MRPAIPLTMILSTLCTASSHHHRISLNQRSWDGFKSGIRIGLRLVISGSIIFQVLPMEARQTGVLSDEDILNPNKLIFNRVVPFIDSFDGARVGTVFVTKRAIMAHPTKGVFGERCAGLCPSGTDEIDASYVYVFQKKGECVIGVRGIGWGEKLERSINGQAVEIGRISHQSQKTNITYITVNDVRVTPPTNQTQLGAPNGTNYKYYPRRQNSLGKTMGGIVTKNISSLLSRLLIGGSQAAFKAPDVETYSSTNEGYITDIHYFPARELLKAARQDNDLVIELPAWQPSRHVIRGAELMELRKLTSTCDAD